MQESTYIEPAGPMEGICSRSSVLLISYLFPPVGGVGVQRALSLARYLPDCGFRVHVLKAANAAAPVYDPGLLRRLGEDVRVHSAFTPELPFAFRQRLWQWAGGGLKQPSTALQPDGTPPRRRAWKQLPMELGRRLLCPEPEVLWVPFAMRAARRIVEEHAIDTVVVTAPPFSAFLCGNRLKKEFPHLRLVTDFRDDWLRFYLGEFDYQKNEYTRRRAIAIERETVDLSDAVVVVTAAMLHDIRRRYPDVDGGKFLCIPNGYDPEAMPKTRSRARSGDGIVVSHVGTVYSASSPRTYLDALDRMPERIRTAFETRFIGRIAASEASVFAGRASRVKQVGFLPQREALDEMAGADYLLLVMMDAASLTGKIFEYLATGKPVLAIARRGGEVERILQETGGGWCADPDDEPGIRAMIERAWARLHGGPDGFRPNWAAIRRYERPRLTAEFARVLRGGPRA